MTDTNIDGRLEELSDKIDELSNKFDTVIENLNRNIGFFSKFENGVVIGGLIGLIFYAIFKQFLFP